MASQKRSSRDVPETPVPPPKPLFEAVAGYLDTNDWHYTPDEEKGYFTVPFNIENASVRVIVDVAESESWQRVLVYTVYLVRVPEGRRAAVAEAIAGINWTLIYGNFEMDPSDGEVRFRTVSESDGAIPDSLIERALLSNLRVADTHFSPLMAVAYGSASPDKVLELVPKPEGTTLQ